MSNLEKTKVKGTVILKRYDVNDNVLGEIVINNMVVNTGLDYFAKKVTGMLDGTGSGTYEVIDKVSISRGTTAVDPTDTEMDNTIDAVYSDIKYKVSTQQKEVLLEGVFLEGPVFEDKVVSEIGLFTNLDRLVARTLVPIQNRFTKTGADYLSVTWKLQFG